MCDTDVEFFTGEMAYLHQGHSAFPMRLGHEWTGRGAAVSAGVDPAWVGRRIMGDTMLGCRTCRRCLRGHQQVCEIRQELGIRGERAGALTEQLAVPASSLHICLTPSTPYWARWWSRAATPCAPPGPPPRNPETAP